MTKSITKIFIKKIEKEFSLRRKDSFKNIIFMITFISKVNKKFYQQKFKNTDFSEEFSEMLKSIKMKYIIKNFMDVTKSKFYQDNIHIKSFIKSFLCQNIHKFILSNIDINLFLKFFQLSELNYYLTNNSYETYQPNNNLSLNKVIKNYNKIKQNLSDIQQENFEISFQTNLILNFIKSFDDFSLRLMKSINMYYITDITLYVIKNLSFAIQEQLIKYYKDNFSLDNFLITVTDSLSNIPANNFIKFLFDNYNNFCLCFMNKNIYELFTNFKQFVEFHTKK